MDKIKLGFIGLGQRGRSLYINVLKNFPEVDIVAVCDSYSDRVERAYNDILEKRNYKSRRYDNADDLLNDGEVNAVLISASWEAHVPLAIKAMQSKKATLLEVGGAYSVEDCFALIKAYEETKTPFVFLENCCYGDEELMVTKMVRKGLFGEISYCHGSYCHDLRGEICGGVKNRHYRLNNYMSRNCDNYPTHELGPIAKLLNINRGNKMVTLSSFSSKSAGIAEYIKNKDEYAFLKDKPFCQGDVVVTNILCADKTLITLKLDTTLPRCYTREFTVSGTKAMYNDCGKVLWVDGNGKDHETNLNKYQNLSDEYSEYRAKIWKDITPEEIKAGHGGMDTLMLKDIFTKLLSGEEMPIDVYDAASWMAVTALSEKSIALGSVPVEVPDFTDGLWKVRKPKDVTDLND